MADEKRALTEQELEAMSLENADIAVPVNAAVAANVLSTQDPAIDQDN